MSAHRWITSIAAVLATLATAVAAHAQERLTPPDRDLRITEIIDAVSADRIEADIQTLVDFGTRHTLSDTLSETWGIGAARRWIHAEFERISEACGGCLEVEYQRYFVEGDPESRIPEDTWVVSVTATLRGTEHPNRYVIMSGDIDSRVSDPLNAESASPGANDNASGMAGTIEAARVLSQQVYRGVRQHSRSRSSSPVWPVRSRVSTAVSTWRGRRGRRGGPSRRC